MKPTPFPAIDTLDVQHGVAHVPRVVRYDSTPVPPEQTLDGSGRLCLFLEPNIQILDPAVEPPRPLAPHLRQEFASHFAMQSGSPLPLPNGLETVKHQKLSRVFFRD